MHRNRTTPCTPSAAALLAALLHGPAGAAPTAPSQAPPVEQPAAAKAAEPASGKQAEKTPDDCAAKALPHEKVACLAHRNHIARNAAPGAASTCSMRLGRRDDFDPCVLRDADLALAVRVASPDEWAEIEDHFGLTRSEKHAAVVVPIVADLLKYSWKQLGPALEEYVHRRARHERRAVIVAALADNICADPRGKQLFASTCAAVAVLDDARHGAVTSLGVLPPAARDDLGRLNAAVAAAMYRVLEAAAVELSVAEDPAVLRAVSAVSAAKSRLDTAPSEEQPEAARAYNAALKARPVEEAGARARAADRVEASLRMLLTAALRDNAEPAAVESLIQAIGRSNAACGLQLSSYAEQLTVTVGEGKPVPATTVVWAGVAVLPACNRLRGPEKSALEQVLRNADKYPRDKFTAAEVFTAIWATPAAQSEDPPPKTADAAKPSDPQDVPAGLRHLQRRLQVSAALADVLGDDAGRWLRAFAESLEIAAAAAAADYGAAAASALRRMQDVGLARQLRHIDMIVVLASEKDEATMERVLVTAAAPAASWRVKSRTRSFNITLSLMPGVQSSAERRDGPYGATLESRSWHYQAPALQLPLGFDFSVGTGVNNLGLFVSTIDPLAYLQYDVNRQGRLPGPSVLTALAPGLGLRVSLGRSPLSLMPFLAFRPRFRAWEPSVAGPGAHALQIGVALTFDIVLHSLLSRPGRSK